MLQTTIMIKTSLEGVGVHTGELARIQVATAPPNTGIVFQVMQNQHVICEIPANIQYVVASQFNTMLHRDGHEILTVEHLLAALTGMGITNAIIKVWGREIPILDGSCRPWIRGVFPDVNIRTYNQQQARIQVLNTIRVEQGDAWCQIQPYAGFRVSYQLDFDHPMIGFQHLDLDINKQNFLTEIAASRTFGFLKDYSSLKQTGASQGASRKNVVVFTDTELCQGQTLRWDNEPVRHKILDVVGDLALAGAPMMGYFKGHKSGHTLNQKLVSVLMSDTSAWCWCTDLVDHETSMVCMG